MSDGANALRPAASGMAIALATETPAERLERSRRVLQQAMFGRASDPITAGGEPGWASSLKQTLQAVPGADVVLDVLGHWWANHPLHSVASVLGEAGRSLVVPTARRNPLALVAGALLAGAVLARLKPWRWVPKTLLFAGLVPQLASRLVAAVPLDTWLSALSSRATHPARNTAPEPARETR